MFVVRVGIWEFRLLDVCSSDICGVAVLLCGLSAAALGSGVFAGACACVGDSVWGFVGFATLVLLDWCMFWFWTVVVKYFVLGYCGFSGVLAWCL